MLLRALTVVVIASLGLPIVICVLVGMARLLAAMEDATGAAVVDRLALACGIAWVLTLVVLLIGAAIRSLEIPRRPHDDE
jgi:hypothetical protein